MICKRFPVKGGDSPGVPSAEAPWGLGLGSRRLGPFLCLGLPPVASQSCLPPPFSLPALPPLRKSSRVRQLKLPLGADFTSPLRIGEPFAAEFFAAGVGLCAVAPERHF